MIAVIADDLSGATELAGISWRFGLAVDICLNETMETNADVIIICTNSRSKGLNGALQITERVLEAVLQLKPSFIYKKIDSALRGHIVKELKLQMKLMGMKQALIIPANPSLGRKIVDKEYFVGNQKINETSFANDPEFPIKHSDVEKHFNYEVVVKKCNDALNNTEIVIGETQSKNDVKCWVDKLKENVMLVGAGDFFTAILENRHKQQNYFEIDIKQPHLYVSGTTFSKSRELVKKASLSYNTVAWVTEDLLQMDDKSIKSWMFHAEEKFKKGKKLILAFDETSLKTTPDAGLIRETMALLTKQIIDAFKIKELFIEGGATAGSILEKLSINRLSVVSEWASGVVKVSNNDLLITIKPGSYQLPQALKNLYGI